MIMEPWKFITTLAANGFFPDIMPCTSATAARDITAANLKEKEFSVRLARLEDMDDLLRIETECWSEQLRIERRDIANRIATFPSGQWVAVYKNHVVGVLYTQRVPNAEVLLKATYSRISELHDPSGGILELIAIAVLPSAQHLQIGKTLRDLMLLQVQVVDEMHEVVAITRCSSYQRENHHNYQHYTLSGEDPTLQFHCLGGAEVVAIVPNYRPEDLCNEGNGVLISYVHKVAQSPLVPTIESAITIENIRDIIALSVGESFHYNEATFPDTPVMSLGIDSLQMLQISNWLQQRTPQYTLPSTFLFDYPTPRRIVEHFAAPMPADQNILHTPTSDTDDIAIVSISCRFPGGASTPEEFFNNLCNMQDGVVPIPDSWKWDEDSMCLARAGIIDDVSAETFDPQFFGLNSAEVASMDPHQRLLLEIGYEALRDAKLLPEKGSRASNQNIGVYVGLCNNNWIVNQTVELLEESNKLSPYTGMGVSQASAANRLSFIFSLSGPSVVVDTACSSSLTALHAACEALRHKQCDAALVCSADLIINPLSLQVLVMIFV